MAGEGAVVAGDKDGGEQGHHHLWDDLAGETADDRQESGSGAKHIRAPIDGISICPMGRPLCGSKVMKAAPSWGILRNKREGVNACGPARRRRPRASAPCKP